MKTKINWIGDRTFVGESPSGHAMVMSAGENFGGRDCGFRPMELLLMGMGGCTAIDVMNVLIKSRQDVVDCDVELTAERASEEPKVFTRIDVNFVIKGRKIKAQAVERAIQLSAEKYCSASIMLGKTARIEHHYEIVEVNG